MPILIGNPSATFTRPNDTTAYTTGDLVANSTTAGSVVPMQFILSYAGAYGNTRLTRARMSKSSTTTTAATFRLHLYTQSPTCANGDNGAWSTNKAANWVASIDFAATPFAFTDGTASSGSLAAGSEAFLNFTNNTGTSPQYLYGLLTAQGAYVPTANETFTVVLEDVASW